MMIASTSAFVYVFSIASDFIFFLLAVTAVQAPMAPFAHLVALDFFPALDAEHLLLLSPEAPELRLLLRVHKMDCLHRQLGEAVGPPNRAAKRARVARVHRGPLANTEFLQVAQLVRVDKMRGTGYGANRASCASRGKRRVFHDCATGRPDDSPGRTH